MNRSVLFFMVLGLVTTSVIAAPWGGIFSDDDQLCPIEFPLEAARLAGEHGFTFSAEGTGAGKCDMADNSVVNIVSTGRNETVTCRVTLFSGRKLHKKWRVTNLSFSHPIMFVVDPKKNRTNDLKTVITYTKPAGNPISLSLKTLTLIGPDCSQWREAFK